jgi:hypothetical protein
MTAVTWDPVGHGDVVRAIQEYDRLGPEAFYAEHGFGPTTTYDLIWEERRYPPKQSWARRTSWPRASAWPPAISRAGRPAP